MKNRIYLIIVMLSALLVSCANLKERDHSSDELEYVPEMIEIMNTHFANFNEEGYSFGGCVLEGKDIVCTLIVDESVLPAGKNLRQACQMVNVDEKAMSQMMKQKMYQEELDEDEELGFKILDKYNYRIIIRIIGEPSGETMNCILDYASLLN